jgi:two-component system OmpR family sensor kinase
VIRMLTIRSKVALAYTLVFGLIFAGFAFLVYRSSGDASLTRLDASIRTYAGRIEAEVQEQSSEHAFPVPAEFVGLPAGDLVGQHFLLRSLDGHPVIGDSLLEGAPGALAAVVSNEQGHLETVMLGGEKYRVYSGPVELNDTVTFGLTVGASMAAVESSLKNLMILFLFSVPAVLLLAAVAAWFITRAAFSPVSSMITTARRFSADNLGARLMVPRTRDEIRLLGETLNGMMDRIESAFRAQRQFIADASHEIRTPLTIIRSDLELLRKRVRAGPNRKEIDAIVTEVDNLGKMAENLLLLSRLDAAPASLEKTTVRVDEVIVECVRTMTPLFRSKGVALRLRIGEAAEISGDREGLKRMVLNLLENSLKFTKRRGSVSVSLSAEPDNDLPLLVTVRDTGCGIAAADLPHIFGRFYRATETRGEGEGSGLGLAIVDHIVRLHGGRVALESEPGRGTTVTIRLPAS